MVATFSKILGAIPDTVSLLVETLTGDAIPQPIDRIARLQDALGAGGFDAALLDYSRSLYYYAGTTQPGVLVVTPGEYGLVVSRGLDRAREESFLPEERTHPGRGHQGARELLESWALGRGLLGLELDLVSARSYRSLVELFDGWAVSDVSAVVLAQRRRKEPAEIATVQEACWIVDQGHRRILDVFREGMTELELSAEVEDAQRRAGHERLYFMRQLDFCMGRGPLASGPNLTRIAGRLGTVTGVGLSSSLPVGASRRQIRQGDLIVVDIPAHHGGYHCDQSRTYSVGPPSPTSRELYAGMREIADRLLTRIRPGVTCGGLDEEAFEIAEGLGLEPHFMRLGDDPRPVGFIGHGLELNEPPLLARGNTEAIEEGMVLALELEMRGPGSEVVKLEDTVLTTPEGARVLTLTPRELHTLWRASQGFSGTSAQAVIPRG